MAPLANFHHVALTVGDLDASVTWYSEVLGFQTLFREEAENRRAAVMTFSSGSIGVGLVEHRPRGGGFDPTTLGLDHLAFNVASRDELDEWGSRLSGAGIAHSGVIDVPPGAILNFKDPDGIALSLFWDRD